SMTCTLSPALLVWMIRTFLPPWSWAARPIVHTRIAAVIATPRRITCLFVMIVSLSVGAARLSHDPVPECLPLGIVLRGEVLAAVVIEVAARVLGQRMNEQLALHATWHHDAAKHIEILPRLFVGPGRRPRVERLQAKRRTLAVARNTACVTRALLQEDRLDLRLEILVVQRGTGRRGRGPLANDARRQQRPARESHECDGLIHAPSFVVCRLSFR